MFVLADVAGRGGNDSSGLSPKCGSTLDAQNRSAYRFRRRHLRIVVTAILYRYYLACGYCLLYNDNPEVVALSAAYSLAAAIRFDSIQVNVAAVFCAVIKIRVPSFYHLYRLLGVRFHPAVISSALTIWW